MPGKRGDDAHESVMFESVGIGPAGGEPVEFVPVDVAGPLPAEHRRGRTWGVAVGLVVVAVFAAAVWATTRSATPTVIDDWPRLPTDPTEAFEWSVPEGERASVWAAGTADNPFLLALESTSGTIYSLDPNGEERWQADIGGGGYAAAYRVGNTVVATSQEGDRYGMNDDGVTKITVTGLDADSGKRLWQTAAPGDYLEMVDDHVVIVDFPDEGALDESDSDETKPSDRVIAYSVDTQTGEQVAKKRFDEVQIGYFEDEILVKLGGEIFTVDGALNPITPSVPAGDGGAGTDDGTVVTIDDEQVTVYGPDGEVIRSSDDMPDILRSNDIFNVDGAGDGLWAYTKLGDTNPDCGVFRFADGDDAPVDLWHEEECYLYFPFDTNAGDDEGDGAVRPYAMLWNLGDHATPPGSQRVIDVTTGATITEGADIYPAANGVAIVDGGHLVGRALGPDSSADPLFQVPLDDDTDDWHLLDGAIAVAQRDDVGDYTSVTIYS